MGLSKTVVVSTLAAMLCGLGPGASLSAEDMAIEGEKSVAGTGEWSDSSLAKGKNEEISEDSLETLPPSLRQIWASKYDASDRQHKDRRKTLTNRDITDEVIPKYGVQYVTAQRNFSRAEPLFHKVRKFLTDLNIRVMAGDLGRRGPSLVSPKSEKGQKAVEGDVALLEQGPLPEEVEITKLHEAMVELRKQISYPNLLEREHFNEIAGDLGKAQGLINYDLTPEGIKRIDEQFAAWRVQIEVVRMRAVEAYTDKLIEENPKLTRERARRQAEKADIEFRLPPLPMGEHALRDARAELNRIHQVRSPEKTNAKKKEREEAAKEEKLPEDVKVDEAVEEMVEEDATEAVEETTEAVEETVEETSEEVTEEVDDFDMDADEKEEAKEEVDDFDMDADETEEAAPEKTAEEKLEEVEEAVEEKAEEMPAEKPAEEKKEDDGFEFEDDFEFE